jgi:hypothetical protein
MEELDERFSNVFKIRRKKESGWIIFAIAKPLLN